MLLSELMTKAGDVTGDHYSAMLDGRRDEGSLYHHFSYQQHQKQRRAAVTKRTQNTKNERKIHLIWGSKARNKVCRF
jgi:hypothetical protein